MLKFITFLFVVLTLIQWLTCLLAVDNLENFNRIQIKNDLWAKNVTLVEKHKLADNKETTVIEKNVSKGTEMEDEPNPVREPNFDLPNMSRTSRQLYYSPNFFFIQNYGSGDSKCFTSRGKVGVCMSFDSCVQAQLIKHLPAAVVNIQQWPAQQKFLPYLQQQPEFCIYFDQFARSSYGICCIGGMQSVVPVQTPQTEIPVEEGNKQEEPEMPTNEQGLQKPGTDEDSEVLEADLNSYQPKPPMYDNTDNNIDYDPIENLKQANLFNYNNNFIRYPWPQQFGGLSGVQQWPPPLPTHPPSIASWPPPLPTHPPNHHYPTHPPLNGVIGGSHIYPDTTITTTRRPTYPNYPTQRPTTTVRTTSKTTTTTTKKPLADGPTMLGLPLKCGLRNAENPDQERIVGGTNASPHEFPWIAVLFKSGKQFCGGSLITNNHILTAAHCVARMTSWDVAALTVHLGDYNIRTDFEVKHITRRIKRLVRHKGFDFSTLHNDVAILTLNEPVHFTKEIQPICLPTSTVQQSRSYSGHIAIVAGWGSLRENGPQPSILQKVQIPIWTNSECAQKYGRAAPAGIISSMICAGQVAKDSCSGDSGGPLIVNDGARYIQVGIVSWGIGCGQGQYPGVYTRVTSLLPWIYKNIK